MLGRISEWTSRSASPRLFSVRARRGCSKAEEKWKNGGAHCGGVFPGKHTEMSEEALEAQRFSPVARILKPNDGIGDGPGRECDART